MKDDERFINSHPDRGHVILGLAETRNRLHSGWARNMPQFSENKIRIIPATSILLLYVQLLQQQHNSLMQ